MLNRPLHERFVYDPQQNLFFINFEGLTVRSLDDVEDLRLEVESRLAPLKRKVFTIVNYENFAIFPEVMDAYALMVHELNERFYSGVTRYTTSSFLRVKLGEALHERTVAPHIYESAEEAREHLRELEKRVAQ
jgi:propionate CoA-transferase